MAYSHGVAGQRLPVESIDLRSDKGCKTMSQRRWQQISVAMYKRSLSSYADREGARRYIDSLSRDSATQEYITRFTASFQPNDKVIDIGSGSGDDVKAMRGRGVEALGIDSSPAMVKYATDKHGPFFRLMDVHDISILGANSCFAGALLSCTLIHLPQSQWSSVLSSVLSILRPDGVVLVTMKGGVGVVRDDRLGADFPRFVQLCRESDLTSLLDKVGFSGIKIEETDDGVGVPLLHAFARK